MSRNHWRCLVVIDIGMYFIVMYLCERGQICVVGDVVRMCLPRFHT